MRTRPYSELRARIPDTPELRHQSDKHKRAMAIARDIGRLQDELASGPTDGTLIENGSFNTERYLEHEEDEFLAELRHGIEMLGGELRISVTFPDQVVRLVPKLDNDAECRESLNSDDTFERESSVNA